MEEIFCFLAGTIPRVDDDEWTAISSDSSTELDRPTMRRHRDIAAIFFHIILPYTYLALYLYLNTSVLSIVSWYLYSYGS